MKILYIITTPFALDGITNCVMNYYRALDRSDLQIDFVLINDPIEPFKSEIAANGGKIVVLAGRNRNPAAYFRKLKRVIADGKYDIVHAHGNSCTLAIEMYAAKRAGAKVRIPHSHNTTCEHKLLHRLLRGLFEASYTDAFACGQKAGEWLFRGRPFTIINNGIDLDRFAFRPDVRQAYRRNYGLEQSVVIGHVGHFSYQKNHAFLLEVFRALRGGGDRYRLALIGDGELRESVERQAEALGLGGAVLFLGKTTEVPQLLQAIDIMVMPSRYEGLPLTLLEAQAACLPCFVSDVVTDEVAVTGLVRFLSLESPPAQWAGAVEALTPPDRAAIKADTLDRIVRAGYSIQDNAEKLKALYRECLRRSEKNDETD